MDLLQMGAAILCLISLGCAATYNMTSKLDGQRFAVEFCSWYVMAYASVEAGLRVYGGLVS